MPLRLDNIKKRLQYFKNVNLDKRQIKCNNSLKWKLWMPLSTYSVAIVTERHHELTITTTYLTITGTSPNKITS